MNEYELHDPRREHVFRSMGGNSTNFYRSASSFDSASQEIFSQLAPYVYYTFCGAIQQPPFTQMWRIFFLKYMDRL
jgi:hypothetical protein